MSISAIIKKICKLTAKYFPDNRVRVWALKQAGYSVGMRVYVGEEFHVTENLDSTTIKLFIGDRVSIGQRVMIILDSHPNWSRLIEKIEIIQGTVRIDSDAWIGAGSIILPNVTIGKEAIVGAGSVVTKDVPPETIVVGNPARILRRVQGD